MNNFENLGLQKDPITTGLRKNMEERGMEFTTKNENRFMTHEEWFEKFYKDQPDEELPKRILDNITPEKLEELKNKYGNKLKAGEKQESDGEFDFS